MTDTLTFGYWGIRGRGQVIRYLLEYTETAYDEKRYLTKEDWFEKAKKSLNLVLSNLPYIIDGDFNLTESLAIQQYIIRRAKKAELLGSHDPKIAGRIIQCVSFIKDLEAALGPLVKDQDWKAKKDAFYDEKLSESVQKVSALLGNKEWFIHNQLTLADFIFYEAFSYFAALWPEKLANFQNLVDFRSRFEAIPQIKNYMASDRFIKAPFLPPGAYAWTGL